MNDAQNHYQRARILLDRHRPKEAEEELNRHLSSNADDPWGHSLLASAFAGQQKHEAAIGAAKRAIALSPHEAWHHYLLGDIFYGRSLYADAGRCCDEAIRLAPTVARYWGLKANIECANGEWKAALVAAETGLEHDADNVHCKNLRALALAKLGKKDQSLASVSEALAQNPENALTFAYQGWTHIHNGAADEAITAFGEALRLQPDLDWARLGMLTALREKHPLFSLGRKLAFIPVDSMSDRTLCLLMQFDSRGKYLLTEAERRGAQFMLIALPVGIAIGVGLGIWRAKHGQPARPLHSHRDNLCTFLLMLDALTVLLLVIGINKARTVEERREAASKAALTVIVLAPVTVLFFAIQYGPKAVSDFTTYGVVTFVLACAFTEFGKKLGSYTRTTVKDWVYKIWPD